MKKRILIFLMVMLVAFGAMSCAKDNVETPLNTNEINETNNVEENELNEASEEEATEVSSEKEYGDFDGFMWEVKNGDATVYLFGSIHIANDSLFPFSEVVEKAFETSDYLGVEVDLTDQAATFAVQPKLIYGPDDNIFNHISEEGAQKFREATKALGLEAEVLQQLKIWVAGSSVQQLQLSAAGYEGATGVDLYYLTQATNMEKPIIELEGIEMQVDLINSFTDEELEATFFSFKDQATTIEEFESLYNVYLSGDEKTVTDFLFNKEEGETATNNVEEKLINERNVGMANKIDEYLQTDETYFVVVGLAHYVGDHSVIKYLEDKGYTVERVQTTTAN